MLVLTLALLALLPVPIVWSHRSQAAALSGVRLLLAWVLAWIPAGALAWTIFAGSGHDWAVALPGPSWTGPALALALMLSIMLLAVCLPVAVITATVAWVLSRLDATSATTPSPRDPAAS